MTSARALLIPLPALCSVSLRAAIHIHTRLSALSDTRYLYSGSIGSTSDIEVGDALPHRYAR